MTTQMADIHDPPLLVIVTGLSGAGKSTAIKALEDLSFYCIDNLPFAMVETAVDHLLQSKWTPRRYAFGWDARDKDFLAGFLALQARLKARIKLDVLFLTCAPNQLAERYSTTRRKHPMLDTGGQLIAAIKREHHALQDIEQAADVSFDTTSWSVHFLARKIEERYSGKLVGRQLHVNITSFGFKNGLLKPADTVFDVRFLRNPFFDPLLKDRTGLESAVANYVFEDPNAKVFLDKIIDLHHFLLPEYYKEGKHYFRIGIGCTGGKHRSVALAERLALDLTHLNIPQIAISVNHRDIDVGM
ncbi:MAG TPA: RNase adapter RapZ [Oligoflexus sp.]|uniref:RNase adapter RapZ n=1 Tax=Oligoflexus sp. TaxID=1971216 RepID=UPI002D455277|nr:RNase adapter RapZ [Oligoflexus sp.]HYX34340.1 RNase adapter RapZ [Oligoflexus sp.]